MRRREKFVLAAVVLSLGLLGLQYVTLELRYLATGLFGLATYIVSAWALADDLQPFEWLTIVPLPALYAMAVGLFYFLLPAHFLSRVSILALFGIGMYALYLTSNIFSVAKGRTIQLVHAAHAIGLLFTLLTSLLFTNTIFSLRLPFYISGALVGAAHFPLIFLSLWSVNLEQKITSEVIELSSVLTLIIVEFAILLTFIPFSLWNTSLLVMSLLYIGLGILQSHLQERLFSNILQEYSAVFLFLVAVFILLFPGK